MTTKKKANWKKNMTRVLCIALAAVMILSTLIAALLSQIW